MPIKSPEGVRNRRLIAIPGSPVKPKKAKSGATRAESRSAFVSLEEA
jgi:hypothetical protein